jgi:hypothetical protein
MRDLKRASNEANRVQPCPAYLPATISINQTGGHD